MIRFSNLAQLKRILMIPVLVFFVFTLSAQSVDKTGSLLWKISGNGLTQPSYIFGTHHLYPLSFLDSVAGLKQAFASSQQMVGELIIHDMMAIGLEMQKAGMMPKDSTWQLLLSEDDYRFVDEQLTALMGVGLQTFGMFKPFLVNVTYLGIFYQKIFPNTNPAEPMDLWFQQQATTRAMPVLGLETVQDQINALSLGSLKQQAADLVCKMRNLDFVEYSEKKLHRIYRSADLSGGIELFLEKGPCPWSSEQEYALNDARNKRWVEKLPAIIADKPSFIAVGCLHLPGEQGVLAGLERAGFTVEAVK